MGAPPFFILFGIVFVGMAVLQGLYHYKNATGKNRMSVFDITDKEKDPLDRFLIKDEGLHSNFDREETQKVDEVNYCPFCGNKVQENFMFCSKCGKELK